jgi:plasmid stabilization system protein ParE
VKVVVTEAAYFDLARISRGIAKDNPIRAETFVAELLDRCRSLGAMPRAYPLLPRWEDRGVRQRVHGNYLIFYRIVGRRSRFCTCCIGRWTTSAFCSRTNERSVEAASKFGSRWCLALIDPRHVAHDEAHVWFAAAGGVTINAVEV